MRLNLMTLLLSLLAVGHGARIHQQRPADLDFSKNKLQLLNGVLAEIEKELEENDNFAGGVNDDVNDYVGGDNDDNNTEDVEEEDNDDEVISSKAPKTDKAEIAIADVEVIPEVSEIEKPDEHTTAEVEVATEVEETEKTGGNLTDDMEPKLDAEETEKPDEITDGQEDFESDNEE